MKQTPILYVLGLALLAAGCKTQYAYYQSPLHTNTTSYKTMPLKSDSLKSATYGSLTLTAGGANKNQRDGVWGFLSSVYRAHSFGQFQGYYGAAGNLGGYTIAHYTSQDLLSSYRNPYLNDSLVNARAGDKFFGSAGVTGGINFVRPYGNGGEWRVIGTEVNWQQEFGNYLSFRKGLPDTAVNVVDKKSNYLTISIGTEFVLKTKKGSMGFKVARVYSTRRLHGHDDNRKKIDVGSGYFSQAFQLTKNRVTGFVQFNWGTYAISTHFGLNCRLSK